MSKAGSEGVLSKDEYDALLGSVSATKEPLNASNEPGLLLETYDFANPDAHIRSIIPGYWA